MQDERGKRRGKAGTGRSPDRLAALKELIEEGRYETEEKLDAALRRMLPDLWGAMASRGDENADGRT